MAESVKNTGLDSKQMLAATMLAEGASIKSVAEQIKMHVNTVGRWKGTDAFRQYYDAQVTNRLRFLKGLAVQTMAEHAENKKNPWLSLNAANSILQQALAAEKTADVSITVQISGAPELGMPEADAIAVEGEVE